MTAGSTEVDFVIDNGSEVIPIEVKAETNLKPKSLLREIPTESGNTHVGVGL